MKGVFAGVLMLLTTATSCLAGEGGLRFYRFDEDWSFLATKGELTGYERLKYIPIGSKTPAYYLTVGGQFRTQFNAFNNDGFGLLGEDDGTLWLNRFTVHFDLHFADYARVFVELGTHQADASGDLEPGPFDRNSANLQQAFIDLTYGGLTARLGRFESPFGSARLVSVRDGPNVRRAFDGAKLSTEVKTVTVDAFYLQEVRVDDSAFDDDSNDGEELWGLYTSWTNVFGLTDLESYYFGSNRAVEQYVQGAARDKRHSVGVRASGTHRSWDWNHEAVYQFGSFGSQDVSAWTVATSTGYRFRSLPMRPRVYLGAAIATGDDDPTDNKVTTFNPLFPNLFYFEEAAILSPQNFINVQPGVTLHPGEGISLSFDWNFFWRESSGDGVYTGGLFPLPGTAASSDRFVTHSPQLQFDWELNKHVEFDLRYNHFFAGETVETAGGRSVDFFMAEVLIRF